jgi:very-short-patch-repair endonuclease
MVGAAIEAGRWRRLGRLLVVLHTGPLDEEAQRWAAVLSTTGLVAAAGLTAATIGGLTGWAATGVELLVPKGARIVRPPDIPIIVHESTRFFADDLHPARTFPQTRMPRSLVDAAVWAPQPRRACGLLCSGVQQRLATPDQLRAELMAAGRVRHRGLLLAAVDDMGGGAQALSEIDFIRLCRRRGLHVACQQEVRREPSGRRRYIDATLVAPSGRVVRVEVDGALHMLFRSYWDDMRRGNELVIGGTPTLRFASIAVRLDEDVVVDQLRRALGV